MIFNKKFFLRFFNFKNLLILFFSVTFLLIWNVNRVKVTNSHYDDLEIFHSLIKSRIYDSFSNEIFFISEMNENIKENLQDGHFISKSSWDRKALNLCNHFNFKSVEFSFRDTSFSVPNSSSVFLSDLNPQFNRQRAIDYSVKNKCASIAGPIDLGKGGGKGESGQGLLIILPLFDGDSNFNDVNGLFGLTIASIECDSHFGEIFSMLNNNDYGLKIICDDTILYSTEHTHSDFISESFSLNNFDFTIHVSHRPSFKSSFQYFLIGTSFVIIFCFLFGGFLFCDFHKKQKDKK